MLRVLDDLGDSGAHRPRADRVQRAAAASGRALDTLPHPWQAFHDVDLGGESADHVCVGPTGVFLVEVAAFPGTVVADPNGLWSHGRRDVNKGVLVKLLRQARKLEETVGETVRPVLVVSCPRLSGRAAWRIPAVPPGELEDLLTGMGSDGVPWHRLRDVIDALQRLTR